MINKSFYANLKRLLSAFILGVVLACPSYAENNSGSVSKKSQVTPRYIRPAQNTDNSKSVTTSTKDKEEDTYIRHFQNFNLSYLGGYSDFGHGYYGIGFETYSNSGMSVTLSFHGSWGLMNPGQSMMRFGVGYGYAPLPWLAIVGHVKGFWCTYTKYGVHKGVVTHPSWVNKPDEITYTPTKDTKFGGGILFAPGVRLNLGSLQFGVTFDLGWAKFGESGFYKDVMLSLGYHF